MESCPGEPLPRVDGAIVPDHGFFAASSIRQRLLFVWHLDRIHLAKPVFVAQAFRRIRAYIDLHTCVQYTYAAWPVCNLLLGALSV